ncbi:serine hydrolase domain-containing protein [Staphylococcus saprophyticus]|uniref:serine hydrolase domain-containing protein n=1 Tax=Staphylococcus saprophyticus TaxID=29385 RepID=UPI000E028A1D|nr:serine hydrolase domain-containing protein [Staphylococcus saprophyticus]SUM90934.1 autolysis and methicillin resistant-related protein [Staphylococcus saprophyticus]
MTTKILKKITIILIILLIVIIITIAYKLYHRSHQETPMLQNETKQETTNKQMGHLQTIVDNQNPQMMQINQYLEQVKFNGTATVFENGQLKLNKGYGLQNIQENKQNQADTLYLIGSSQKFATGLMLKQLESENKINMNDSVTKYLPWFKTKQPITLNQLMLHKSGLFKYKASPNYKNLNEAVHAIQQKNIEPKFYNKNRYNDGNYLVLSRVIEEVTNKSYKKNFEDRISKPQHLNFTAFFDDPNFQAYMAKGYKKDGKSGKPLQQYPNVLEQYYGAGNLYMTPSDMGKLILGLQNNGILNSHISKPLIHESKTSKYPQPYRYGFYSFADKNRINGGFFGQVFTSYFNDKYIVILGTNYENSDVNNEQKIQHIYNQILKQGGPYNHVGKSY